MGEGDDARSQLVIGERRRITDRQLETLFLGIVAHVIDHGRKIISPLARVNRSRYIRTNISQNSEAVMRRILGILASLILLLGVSAAHAAEITVLAAASLTDALGKIDADFEQASGNTVKAAFGGSSALAKQLE